MAKQQVWEYRELRLQYELVGSGSAGTITVELALPGAALAPITIPTPGNSLPISAETTQSWPLGNALGATHRVTVTPSTTTKLKLFGGHLMARPLGEFFDGSRGEAYTSNVITPGMGG